MNADAAGRAGSSPAADPSDPVHRLPPNLPDPYLRSLSPGFGGSWLWLFPLTYVAHAVEEIWAGGGYAAWISSLSGQSMTDGDLLLIHVALIVGMIVVVAVVRARQRFFWSIVAFAVVFVGNALMHAVSTWVTRSYSPGLVTGLLVWGPMGVFAVWLAHRALPRTDVVWGTAVGVVATVVISLLALNPSLIPIP